MSKLRDVIEQLVADGFAPGVVFAFRHHGATHIEAVGNLAFDGPGASVPMATNTICRLGSMTKPIVTACAMTLVDDATLRLDDPVDELLPELADMRVLRDHDGPIDDTVAAHRPITLRDLLTYTLGTGIVPAEPGTVPIADALNSMGRLPADEWITRLGALPLVHQPGERWMYHTAADITGVLIARATGMSLGAAIEQRVLCPLGMVDTGFTVTDDRLDRFATAYALHGSGTMQIDSSHGAFRGDLVFESGGGGLVSTADDYLTFATALLAGGSHGGSRLLSTAAVDMMTTDHLTPDQKAVSGFGPGYFDDIGWGFGMSVRTRQAPSGQSIGTYGWPGYFGSAWYNDPATQLSAIVMMQRAHAGDQKLAMWCTIWAAVYQTLER